MTYDIIIIGAGIFGISTAVTLQQRGWHTAVLDPGPLPHPLAASTDISKVIRTEYGTSVPYMEMVEQAIAGWQQWNEQYGTLYHQTGVTMFTRETMAPGGFEYESYQLSRQRGHKPERLNVEDISHRFPAWKPGAFVDGFYHALGGYITLSGYAPCTIFLSL